MTGPETAPPASGPRARAWGLAALVAAGSLAWFLWDLDREPLFVDEAAFLSQGYFGDLWAEGRLGSPLWLEYPAYDLPPLPKYLINGSLRLHGLPRPSRDWALRWYANTSEARFVTGANLRAARLPSAVMGTIGCVALFALGTMVGGVRAGLLAAVLLAANPLYRLHARRAMADVPAEALILTTVALGLLAWRGIVAGRATPARLVAGTIAVGVAGGLAVLAKLNGALGLAVVSIASSLPPILWHKDRRMDRRAEVLVLGSAAVGIAVFIALNPFVTARPANLGSAPLLDPIPPSQPIPSRLFKVVKHRVDVSKGAGVQFPHNALPTVADKLSALAVQGFGRFGPFGPARSDSRIRYDGKQDWGVALWLPIVAAGFGVCLARAGRGDRPASWAAAFFLLAAGIVGGFLPLAWDRYFLSIQPAACLMGAVAVVAAIDAIRRRGAER